MKNRGKGNEEFTNNPNKIDEIILFRVENYVPSI
jgi:hypothetical protein